MAATFVTQTSGSGKSEIYLLLPRYQFSASGLYQLPPRHQCGGQPRGAAGLRQPFFHTTESSDPHSPEKRVLLVDPNDQRLPAVVSFDARGEKAFTIQRSSSRSSLDVFNVMNSSTVLGRQYDVTATGTTGFNQPLEIMNPRLLRFGVRFSF